MNTNLKRGLVAVGVLTMVGAANAAATAIDTSAATDGIAGAQAAVLVVIGAMITFAAARYGLKKVLGLLGR